MATRYWLLTISYAGTDWRWSSEPVSPSLGSESVPHHGGLDVDDLEETCSLFEVQPEPRSVALSLTWPRPGLASLVADGYDPSTAMAELSLWVDGDDYADREVHIVGRLEDIEWGGVEEPVVATLAELPYDDDTQVPDAQAIVDTTSWPTAHADAMGRIYPQVRGLPGHITGRTAIARDIPGSMAPAVTPVGGTFALLAGHRVRAETVTIFDDQGGSAAGVSVIHRVDGRGRLCALADLYGVSGITTGGAEYGVSWPLDGGRADHDGGVCEMAGELLCARLAETRLRIDWPQVRAVAPLLDWLVVVQADEDRCSPWAWIQDHLLPLLPVSIVASGRGLRLIPWWYEARREQARYHLRSGENCTRESGAKLDLSHMINDCTVKFARNAMTGELEEWVRVHGGEETGDDREHVTQAARLSRLALRTPDGLDDGTRAETIEADIVCSERSAIQIAVWRVEALSRPRLAVRYWLPSSVPIEIGDVIELSDADLSLSGALAIVSGRMICDREEMSVELMLIRGRP